MTSVSDIEQSEIIVGEYGKVLSNIEPSVYGVEISRLPYEKEKIKIALQTLLLTLKNENQNIYDGLTQAYVYLAQFIPDEQVKIAAIGRAILQTDNATEEDLELANQAIQTINGIKTEMENLMNEIRLLIP